MGTSSKEAPNASGAAIAFATAISNSAGVAPSITR